MDSIEKAMFGRSLTPSPPAVARPAPSQADSIERMTGIAKDQTVVRVADAAANKRTQRSVTLDVERMRASGLLVVDAQRSRTKEEYRHIKRTLLMNMDGKGAAITKHSNLVGVTSARPGDCLLYTSRCV